MNVQLICPGCNSELTATDDIVGQTVSCPQCKTQFHVAPETGNDAGAAAHVPPPTPPPVEKSQRPGAVAPGLKNIANRSISAPDGPPVQQPRRAAQPRRKPKQAKFITADATATKVQLGADGQLPELKLNEVETDEKDNEEASSGTSPLLLVVLAISIVSSVVLLLLDTSASRSESRTKRDALERLETPYYIGEPPTKPEPFQLLIRQALQAHRRGDLDTERQLYKRVLDLLHAEGKNKFTGLTGNIYGETDSDEELEKLINTLRRQ